MIARSRRVVLDELVLHFSQRPFGWPEWEIVLLVAKLFVAGRVELILDDSSLKHKEAVGPLLRASQRKDIKIVRRKAAKKEDLQGAQDLGKDVFGAIGPDSEDELAKFLVDGLRAWGSSLRGFRPLADTGDYPGKRAIDGTLTLIDEILAARGSYELIRAFNEKGDQLRAASNDVRELTDFYVNQRPTWESLRKALAEFGPNEAALRKDEGAAKALGRLREIHAAESPYAMLKEVGPLISIVSKVNDTMLEKERAAALEKVGRRIGEVQSHLDRSGADDDLRTRAASSLNETKKRIEGEASIPGIVYCLNEFEERFSSVWELIERGPNPDKHRTVRKIRLADLTPKPYLDTKEDVEAFLAELRKRLLKALEGNARVRIV